MRRSVWIKTNNFLVEGQSDGDKGKKRVEKVLEERKDGVFEHDKDDMLLQI